MFGILKKKWNILLLFQIVKKQVILSMIPHEEK